MKNLLRTRCFVLCLFVMSLLAPSGAKAGIFFVPCMVACIAGCAAVPPCIAACGAVVCLASCLEGETKITVLEQGKILQKDAKDILAGETVLTLRNGQPAWTKVLRNLRTEGTSIFVQITVQDIQDGSQKQIKVTPEHGLVLSKRDGNMMINAAGHVKVGDQMIASNGNILSVIDVTQTTMNEKYTLETSDGTILASDLFMTTLCSEEVGEGELPFESTMKDWNLRHNFSENN